MGTIVFGSKQILPLTYCLLREYLTNFSAFSVINSIHFNIHPYYVSVADYHSLIVAPYCRKLVNLTPKNNLKHLHDIKVLLINMNKELVQFVF